MSEIKFTDVAEFLGIEAKDIDSFKESFEKDFLRVSTLTGKEEVLKPIFGKAIGSVETKIKQAAKKYNAEWVGKDFDEKPIHEKVDFVLGKIIEDNNAAMEELKRTAGQGNDEKVREWEDKYTKLEGKYKDTDTLLKGVKTEYETFKQQKESEFKGLKLNTIKEEAFKKIKFKSGISEIEKRGFDSIIGDKYKIDLDDKGEAFISDKEGQRIKSAKVTGTFKTIDEVLSEEAILSKVIEINPHANGRPAYAPQNGNGAAAPIVQPQTTPRYVHPSAMA